MKKKAFTLAEVFLPHSAGRRKIAFTLAEVFSPHSAGERKIAFTLAEVLITLGIIGVVAALTLPTLIQNYQKKQTVTQLKKAYAELSQAISLAQKDHGTIDSWDFADFENPSARSQYFFDNYLEPNLKILKACVPSSSTECWDDTLYTLKGNRRSNFNNHDGKFSFLTASGYSVYGWLHSGGNGAWFYVDINGKKAPNTFGKDIFIFLAGWGNAESVKPSAAESEYLRKLGLNGYGLDGKFIKPTREQLIDGSFRIQDRDLGCSKSTGGFSCAALIIYDGWEISDDYPW